MNNDFLDPINAENMRFTADAAFATNFLIAVKNGVRNCAFAITETASPEARAVLRQQLADGLTLHDEVTALAQQKGWFHPYELQRQFRLDMSSADTVVKIAGLELWPDDTTRRGLDATPNI